MPFLLCTHILSFRYQSDAPQVDTTNKGSISASTGISVGGDWDENALSAKLQSSTLTTTGGVKTFGGNGGTTTTSSSEILDMKTTYESQLNEKVGIQEKLRLEETRKQLAAAREGMKKQEEKLKEEAEAKQRKEQEELEARNGASGGADAGGKWIPSRIRTGAGVGGSSRPTGWGRGVGGLSSTGRQINMNDEELFPDLATADKLIKQEEEQKQLNAAKAKTVKPAWGAQKKVEQEEQEQEAEPKEEENISKETAAIPSPAPTPEIDTMTAPVTTAASVAEALKKKPKKKKKDLSTFKA